MKLSNFPASEASFGALAWMFARRELKARFKGTWLGWLWSLIMPLATLGLYAIVFGVIFRAQVQPFGNGHPPIYAVWLFLGLITFNFFANGLLRSAESLWGTAGLLNKVKLPVLAPIVGALIAVGLQSLVELILFLVVLMFLLNVGWTWLLVPIWLALLFVFTAGLAVAAAVVAVRLRDLLHALAVLLQFALFATPVMYPLTMIPADAGWLGAGLRDLLGAAPLARFVEMGRTLLYDLRPGGMDEWLVLAMFAVLGVAVGAVTAKRYGQDVAELLQ